MDSILTSASGLAQRLAATIPSAAFSNSNDHPSLLSASAAALDYLTSGQQKIITSPTFLQDLLSLTIIVVLALELLTKLVYHVPKLFRAGADSIPVRGKHLDNFSWKDVLFIGINKCMTGLFVYCYFGYLWSVRKVHNDHGHAEEDHHHNHHEESSSSLGQHHDCCSGGAGIWSINDLSLSNTLLPLPLLFLTYDFFYTLLHWFLHVKSIYAYVHKHHHHQKAPSRANIDAVNVHPLEFFLGEFNHVLALHLVVRGMPLLGFHGMDVSWLAATLFIALGGILAGLNHTRHNIVARIPNLFGSNDSKKQEKEKCNGWTIFDSKHHDVHHRIPQSNYGQYTVIWDRIFGTFREYNENDRVNPAYQLDPVTGKTVRESLMKKE